MYGAFTLSGWLSQNHSITLAESRPRSEPQHARTLVWALSLSLAATQEIEFSFSSSGYLDVSVHRVPFHTLCGYLLLPEAFRSLSRLSSALGAKASALCSFLLGLSDAIALTSDGLLVFFYHCSRSASFSSLSLTFNVSSRNECFTYAVFKVQCTTGFPCCLSFSVFILLSFD